MSTKFQSNKSNGKKETNNLNQENITKHSQKDNSDSGQNVYLQGEQTNSEKIRFLINYPQIKIHKPTNLIQRKEEINNSKNSGFIKNNKSPSSEITFRSQKAKKNISMKTMEFKENNIEEQDYANNNKKLLKKKLNKLSHINKRKTSLNYNKVRENYFLDKKRSDSYINENSILNNNNKTSQDFISKDYPNESTKKGIDMLKKLEISENISKKLYEAIRARRRLMSNSNIDLYEEKENELIMKLRDQELKLKDLETELELENNSCTRYRNFLKNQIESIAKEIVSIDTRIKVILEQLNIIQKDISSSSQTIEKENNLENLINFEEFQLNKISKESNYEFGEFSSNFVEDKCKLLEDEITNLKLALLNKSESNLNYDSSNNEMEYDNKKISKDTILLITYLSEHINNEEFLNIKSKYIQ